MKPAPTHEGDSLLGLPSEFSATFWPSGSARAAATSRPTEEAVSKPVFAGTVAPTRPLAPPAGEDSWSPTIPAPIPDTGPQAKAYELGRVVGRGAMGEVYEARQAALGRQVAVKTIREDNWESSVRDPRIRAGLRMEFVQESLIAARLEHPNIAPVHDLGFGEGGRPLLAMKLVRGQSWASMIGRDLGAVPESEFLGKHLPILKDMAQAVAFAHSRGIMHRDLKPSQVMVGDFGETVLMDWGLALQFAPFQEPAAQPPSPVEIPTVDTASNPAGTPALMAPEQTESSARRLGPHTDVYLLGGTLYLLLTGTFPHQGETMQAVLKSAARGIVQPPHERAPDRWIPEELAALALHCMDPKPEARVASAEVFIQALRDYLSGANRQRESQALVAEAQTLAGASGEGGGTREIYVRHAAVAERLARALELWPQNRFARELRAENLASRILTETDSGDLLLAETHLAELRALVAADPDLRVDIAALAGEVQGASDKRARQHRQRVRFAWAAGLLLLGHGVGMTYSFISARAFASHLSKQQETIEESLAEARSHSLEAAALVRETLAWEHNPPPDLDRRNVLKELGHVLAFGGDYADAIPYLEQALELTRKIDGPESAAAREAAAKLGAARAAAGK